MFEDVNELMIGTYAGGVSGMVEVSSLGEGEYASAIEEGSFTVDPAHYSQTIILGDGTEEVNGWLQTSWHINGLRAEQYDALVAYKVSHSTQVYIRTLDNDGATYKNYLALMIWPVKPSRGDPTAVEEGAVFDFELRFTQMIEQS
jgi:hypothetical protein